ncbi:MAG: TRM11 family methyltransferase [Acidimicrobiales bacterium]
MMTTPGPTRPSHPARFSDPILIAIAPVIDSEVARLGRSLRLLDPFAGIGGVHKLARGSDDDRLDLYGTDQSIVTIGVELEPEWAGQHARNVVGDATALPFSSDSFDVVVTSPTYGNRMADHHNAKDGSRRITYRHTLGRPLSLGNSGAMQWGEQYWELHGRAWAEAKRVLGGGGLLVVNVSDHIRQGQVVPVVTWHLDTLVALGFTLERLIEVPTDRMRFGANHSVRVRAEHIMGFRLP